MSFLNGAELCINFAPETEEMAAARAAADAAQAARDADVADIGEWIAAWRRGRGLPETIPAYPDGWPFEDEDRRAFISAYAE